MKNDIKVYEKKLTSIQWLEHWELNMKSIIIIKQIQLITDN